MSVYNAERFLGEAVDSVLRQSFADFEFIVIDDGSTDSSVSILHSYAVNDERLLVYHQENRGLIDALNRGCNLARGKYIARMDADDIAFPDRLQRQVEFMERHPKVSVVGSAIEVINGAGHAVGVHRYPTNNREITQRLRKGDCPLVHPTVLIRKEVFCSVGGYRQAMVDAEDYDLWLRMAGRSQLANLDTVLLKYRRHPNQVSIQRSKRQALSNLAARVAAKKGSESSNYAWTSGGEITAAMLTEMGIGEVTQNAAIARGYLTSICSMYEAREYSVASSMINELLCSTEWRDADTPVVADLRLLEACLYWRQRQFASSIVSVVRGILTRPIILARPLKPLIRRILPMERTGKGVQWLGGH